MYKKMRCKLRGYMLLTGILSSILFIMLAGAYFTTLGGSFGLIKNSQVALQAQQYGEIASNTLSLISYDELDNLGAHNRRAISNTTGWEDEVTIAPEQIIDPSAESKQRIATVKIYKTGDVLPRYSLQVPLSSQDSGNFPKGTILPFSGELSKIPRGWALCDGKNGNPDLRGRFLIGSGDFADAFGSLTYAIGSFGGERLHTLTIAEMPQHNHILSSGGFSLPQGCSRGSPDSPMGCAYDYLSTSKATDYVGGNQPHNNLPPYFTVHWIIKK